MITTDVCDNASAGKLPGSSYHFRVIAGPTIDIGRAPIERTSRHSAISVPRIRDFAPIILCQLAKLPTLTSRNYSTCEQMLQMKTDVSSEANESHEQVLARSVSVAG